jgi:16S rRNA (cytosine967-C5)-methyltransferase
MAVSPARAAAFDILVRVERESSYAAELLHSHTYQGLSTADHALATELVMGVLRWQSNLDEEIGRASAKALGKIDLEVLIALRLAVYQLRRLDRIPQRAALHESVELVKRARKRSAAPFVNAVLRRLSGSPGRRADEATSAEMLAEAFAHPLWLVERWSRDYGLTAAKAICGYDQRTPTTTIRLRTVEAESEIVDEGITLTPGSFLTSARRVQAGDVTKTRALRRGDAVIQDEGSQLVAVLAGSEAKEGSRILDCCAAPGGKTLAMADENPRAEITAVEVHPHRARRMREMLTARAAARLGTIQILAADARRLPFDREFERILVDVPCSGTGTLARNPEIKWRLRLEDLTELQERQVGILRSAMGHLAPGGRLIYSTCSLEKEENEDVVEQALAGNASLRVVDCRAPLDALREAGKLAGVDTGELTRGPYLRTIPGVQACDGFFAAIVERG